MLDPAISESFVEPTQNRHFISLRFQEMAEMQGICLIANRGAVIANATIDNVADWREG